jgi:hydroxyacid-oxoacid transhydrogenase
MDTSSIRFGPGVTREVGYEMARLGASCVMLVVDPHLAEGEAVATARASLLAAGIDAVTYDGVRCEPTDVSFKAAIRFASKGHFDGYVAVGGGSTMDTAKVANLYTTYPADFMAYINAPIGEGRIVPGPLKPLIAIPTTAGTGSETTGTAICDIEEMHVKTGISHRALRPAMGILDPLNTRTLSPMATACTGFDVLAHALESLTALPYSKRLAPENPGLRPAYQGTNPISDVWAAKAIEMVSQNIMRAIEHPEDAEARGQMLLGASFAGIGFGNAGVHLVHGMSYPVSGMARGYIPEGYVSDHPIIPHGMAVVLNAPAVFRFTAPSDPQRHLWGAQLMGVDVSDAVPEEAGEILAKALTDLMREAGIPNGLSAVGFGSGDIPALVAGTLPQHRVTKLCPRPFDEADLARMFEDAMVCW